MSKQQTTLTAEHGRLIDRCLNLDDCKLAFVLQKAEQILAGETVPDPEQEPDKVKAEWEDFKAEWKKAHAAPAPAESRKEAQA